MSLNSSYFPSTSYGDNGKILVVSDFKVLYIKQTRITKSQNVMCQTDVPITSGIGYVILNLNYP